MNKIERVALFKDTPELIPHGTNGYSNYGCKCEICCHEQAEWAKGHRDSRRELISTYKIEQGCKDCGYNEYACALDFDHLGDKSFEIGSYITASLKLLWNEIAKCDVVCAICHRVRTAIRDGQTLHRKQVSV